MIYQYLLYWFAVIWPCQSTLVVTTSGPIRGKLVDDNFTRYFSYQGIPYAENPTGELRFRPPIPKAPWTEVLDATQPGSVCHQEEGVYIKAQMSEDCLVLNIYVPANNCGQLPVFVMVHSGEFTKLSGDDRYIYGPQLLMQRDVIFVTMNYRLGALGFLSVNNENATGNAAIKDVLLALKWIKMNIDRFGGDPNKITLGGNSAGSVLVHYILLSTKSTGLFERAIMISGSALGFRFLARHPVPNALALGKELGIETDNVDELLQKLKAVSPFDIVKAQESMGINDTRKGLRPFAPFVPCVEIASDHAIITEDPMKIIKTGIPQNVPILAGFNAQEGIKMLPNIIKDQKLEDLINENFELTIPSNIEYPLGSEQSKELAASIRKFYFDGGDVSNITFPNFVNLVRDIQFSYSIDSWIKLHKERPNSNVLYYYVFAFDGELNFFKLYQNLDFPGTAHADELGYIFVTEPTEDIFRTIHSKSQRMVDIMVTYLTNFVKFGDPTPDGDVKWPGTNIGRTHLLLNDHPEVIQNAPIRDFLEFWYKVYDQYYQYVIHGGQLEEKTIP